MNWGAAVLILAGIGIVAVGVTGSQKTICQAISGSDCAWMPTPQSGTSNSSSSGNNNSGVSSSENSVGLSIEHILHNCNNDANCSRYSALASKDASNWGIDSNDFVRQIAAESAFNPNAKSPAGAEGIAQFMPATAAGIGINPYNPEQSLNAAARLMQEYNNFWTATLTNKTYGFTGGADEAEALSLSSYNMGDAGTIALAKKYGAGWMQKAPQETQNYILGIEYPTVPIPVGGYGGG